MYLFMDPGTRDAGVALFDNNKILTDVALLRSKLDHVPSRVLEISVELTTWLGSRQIKVFRSELPQIYPDDNRQTATKKKFIDPNDLIKVATVVGAGILAVSPRAEDVDWCLPREWKQQKKKDIVANIVKLTLTEKEKELLRSVNWDHNVVEAVGIGLWYLKRSKYL